MDSPGPSPLYLLDFNFFSFFSLFSSGLFGTFLNIYFYLFTYLAAVGLSCGMQNF